MNVSNLPAHLQSYATLTSFFFDEDQVDELADLLTDAQKKAYIIADNRLAELAGWDNELLKVELSGLIALDFNVELSGFLTGEADIIIDGVDDKKKADPADALPVLAEEPAVSIVVC